MHCGGAGSRATADFADWRGLNAKATAKTEADPYGMTTREATAKATAEAERSGINMCVGR